MKPGMKHEMKHELKHEMKHEMKREMKREMKHEMKHEMRLSRESSEVEPTIQNNYMTVRVLCWDNAFLRFLIPRAVKTPPGAQKGAPNPKLGSPDAPNPKFTRTWLGFRSFLVFCVFRAPGP